VTRCICRAPQYNRKLQEGDVRALEMPRGYAVSEDMMTALAVEYVRDREGLMQFLTGVFRHWRKILKNESLWNQRRLVQEAASILGRDRKRLAEYLEKTGAVPETRTEEEFDKLQSKIGQFLSRDQKRALTKHQ
jgi:hypothetical protein